MRYSGSSNFIIWLLDHNGEKVELLANEIGSFSGRKALGVSDGDYLLDIAAHGPWSVDISQPNPDTAQSTPATFSGRGSQVSEIFTLPSGLAIFKLNHDGKRNFIVWLLDRNGNKLELLANEIGTFDGSKATNIRDNGEYCLDIKADGNWNIGVNQ